MPDNAELVCRFFVPGEAKTAGSKKGFILNGKDGSQSVRVADASGEKGKSWRARVSLNAQMAMGGRAPVDGPLAARVVFVFKRPKAHYTKRGLRPNAPLEKTTKPDATKHWRAAEDAMTGIVWSDDARIWRQSVDKVWGERPGMYIAVWRGAASAGTIADICAEFGVDAL